MLNQQQKDSAQNIFKRLIKDYPFSNLVVQTLIPKISEQKPFFEKLDQLSDGAQILALTKENLDAALEFVDCAYERPKNCIETKKKECEQLKKLIQSEYLDKIFYCFYLIGNDTEEEEIDKDSQNEENQKNKFFVLEMNKFMRNWQNMLYEIITSKNYKNQVKETIAIQMPEGLDLFNSRNILNREIKQQNFQTNQKRITSLCVLGYTSTANQFQSYNKSIKRTQSYFGTKNEKRFSIILELDNLIILCGQWIQQDITQMYQSKGILAKFKDQINRKSNIFQIFEICLHSKYQQRKQKADFIQLLMKKQQNQPNFMIYSTISPDVVKEQTKVISQYSLKKQANESILLEQIELIKLFEQLFNNKHYNISFEVISGSYRIVLATKNVKRVQDTVIKISTVEDKKKIENEVKIMKKPQMSLIVEFYDHQYIKEQNNKNYAAQELDRFSCSLKQYLQRLKIDADISKNDKLQICFQITGSVSYLQSFNLVYNDLKPDNFLILIKNKNQIITQICDFGISFYLNSKKPFITEKSIGSLVFQTSEVVNNDKNKIQSKKIHALALTLKDQNSKMYTMNH
ncbi:hypothetical protein ABPG72_020872, partial [Tetrahymena utriculariae]